MFKKIMFSKTKSFDTKNLKFIFSTEMESLLNKLLRDGVIKNEDVFKAMLQVDRADFTKYSAYEDW
jgi:hypothetical protein